MTVDQKIVAFGAGSGAFGMAVLLWLLCSIFSSPWGMETTVARLVYTLRFDVVALLPLFMGLIAVGNGRFLSDAIDPLLHAESRALEINSRFVDNTLQQTFVFVVATLALSTYLTPQTIKVIPALVAVFVCARIVFWIGYRIHPLYRAPGMAATASMNLGILLFALYFLITSL